MSNFPSELPIFEREFAESVLEELGIKKYNPADPAHQSFSAPIADLYQSIYESLADLIQCGEIEV